MLLAPLLISLLVISLFLVGIWSAAVLARISKEISDERRERRRRLYGQSERKLDQAVDAGRPQATPRSRESGLAERELAQA